MSLHDLISNVQVEQVLAPQTIQAAALNTGNIDTRGSGTVAVVLAVGNIVDTLTGSLRVDVKIEHADDDGTGNPSAYTACTDDDVLNFTGLTGTGIFLSLDAAGKKSKRYVIGYKGTKRFVKVTATPVSVVTGGPVAMLAMKGRTSMSPVNNA